MARIMIVDDAPFMRQMILRILEAQGYEICAQAASAIEAVERYKQFKPDLVTMDIVMPMMEELDGIGAIRRILTIDPAARILICSAIGQLELVTEAVRAGAADFITKPIQPQRLIEAVQDILKAS
jgi:two-component system, chemotaxis family, chemotaxis protein CheY